MFEDRSKNYNFDKIDSAVRTKVITEKLENVDKMTEAQKKLFSTSNPEQKNSVLMPHSNVDVSGLPSTKYLQSFDSNLTVGEAETTTQEQILETTQEQSEQVSNINFDKIMEEASEIKVDEKTITKELKNIAPAPKKSYSFRIKLVAGVYCILVALFAGWVIGNAIDIAHTNSEIYESIAQTKEVDANIENIILKIKKYDDASKNPEDDSLLKEMITTEIETTPEAIIEPNEYIVESNWFDVFCNWISKIFGGR